MDKSSIKASNLRVEYQDTPIGMDEDHPRFSWIVDDARPCAKQTVWQIIAKNGKHVVWNSGKISSGISAHHIWNGEKLQPRTSYRWQVRLWDADNTAGEWVSGIFETGMMNTVWSARWIRNNLFQAFMQPPAYFRKEFTLSREVVRARLYCSALGLYLPRLNGQEITDNCFMPGWTDYYNRIQYQAYDVSRFLSKGANTLGAILGEGWCCGRPARHHNWFPYGRCTFRENTALIMQLEVELENGERQIIGTDDTWHCTSNGPLRLSDFYEGENFDARMEMDGWDCPGYREEGWVPASLETVEIPLVWNHGVPVRRHERLSPQKIMNDGSGRYLLDFGQNFAGREQVRIRAEKGTVIRFRHGEMLQSDGSLYTENLRSARATSVYIADGRERIYEPTFTFYGFRYLEITGWQGPLREDDIHAIVLHSDVTRTGYFECSDPLLNRLYLNTVWGQKSNFVDIPTDCPQRDERLGWTGDAQVFIRTAAFHSDIAAFFTKWLADLDLSRNRNGEYPPWAPYHDRKRDFIGASGWADAGIICPWTIYLMYGDQRILERYYDSMLQWILFQERESDHLIRHAAFYKDWLNINEETSEELISTAFFAYGTHLMSKISAVLGRKKDTQDLNRLFEAICRAYTKHFITDEGKLREPTQTAAILTLHFGLVRKELRPEILKMLVSNIVDEHDMHLSTGFLGTPYLLHVLSDNGFHNLACRILHQKTYPSWLYPVTHGATTIWERWNSWSEKGFGNPKMNSFNHYAYGAVVDWFYGTLCGIRPCEESPGFRKFVIAPKVDPEMQYAAADFHSPCGRIRSAWKHCGTDLIIEVEIPANTEACLHLPDTAEQLLSPGKYQFIVRL